MPLKPRPGFTACRLDFALHLIEQRVDRDQGCLTPRGNQPVVHHIDGGNQVLGFLDEPIGTRCGKNGEHPLQGWTGLVIPIEFQLVELDTVPGLAEFVPGRLLVLVEVFQVVIGIREIEQIGLAPVEPFDELV